MTEEQWRGKNSKIFMSVGLLRTMIFLLFFTRLAVQTLIREDN